MNDQAPSLSEVNQAEERLLDARLEAARLAITHGGEKGRALEHEVATLLRSFLPAEYGLSTGFVAHIVDDRPRLSPQLDIIIYDALRGGPLVRLGTCDVFPLESVYGYVEVKTTIRASAQDTNHYAPNSLEKCLEQNKDLRSMSDRYYLRATSDSPMSMERAKVSTLGLRSYLFAFDAEGTTANTPRMFAQRMADYSAKLGNPTHLHGVFVAGRAYYSTRPVDVREASSSDYYHVRFTEQHKLSAFKFHLTQALATFGRIPEGWTPALDLYQHATADWESVSPL